MSAARYTALDVFRGLTVCVMIVVNTSPAGAEPFAQLQHAPWFGFTLADLVFPSFLFAIGNSMVFAFRKPLPHKEFLLKVARRAALIFLLGFLMYWFPFVHQTPEGAWAFNDIGHIRIMGVLQRIALCYLFAALAARYLSVRSVAILCVVLLLGYWGLLYAVTPASEAMSMAGNLGAKVDQFVLGLDHMYRGGAKGYDPEGLLSTLPAIVNVLAGYLCGRLILHSEDRRRTVLILSGAGLALVAAALVWNLGFPFSKRLWTSSFALLTIGLDCLILSGVIAWVDLAKRREGLGFFETFGRNPLVIYLFSELLVISLQTFKNSEGHGLYDLIGLHLFQTPLTGSLGALACAIVYMLVCWALGWWMDRRGIIVKL
ncbi:acyltransferase family protein [Asticcacaulis sp. AND118]|uniref:acyltransferase family protein n=1 Tax=Asticcacaulis sp. AND118 TaxID=2840468 RepID=UPI001CFFA216|nr:heparan-alpha-glucosaminide N-acetyltransferase domain-containing protein [Asticcacaulis sp. AND118]UDF05712.1 heparan-alpha-glucosaminide N-acetyltransferase domain-containing protein [Asticcacaulis sp. AND118]